MNIDPNRKLKAVLLESSRNHTMGALTVDISMRDLAEGAEAINIIIYKAPDVGRNVLEPAILQTCREVFSMNKSGIDLVYRDEADIAKQSGLSRKVNAFDSWLIEIMPPRSYRFSVPMLKQVFLTKLNSNL